MEKPVTPEPGVLMERIARLERSNRRLSAAVVGFGALALASFTAGVKAAPRSFRIVEASQFLLKASETEVRGELRIHPTEGGKLYLCGNNGGQTLELPLRQQVVPLGAAAAQ